MKAFSRLFVFLCLTAVSVWAQGTAQISGTVKDAGGLAVPGAEVKATQTGTGAARTVTSGADGTYALPNLPIGPYMLEVSKTGFTKYVQTGILLQVDSSPTIDAALKVGSINEQVTVQADANLVETHSTSVGTVVDSQRVVEMPLNGRNATELIFLAGAANTGGSNGGFLSSVRNYPTIMVSVTGGVGNWITYNWDGANHNDAYNSLNYPIAFPDALQEFKVESSALPAQYGMHASANVNLVTKSGTNEFHGDAFEFLRNGDLNARDYFQPTRDSLKRNQFGGTVGGRIIRDKLFFFAGFQDTVQKSDPAEAVAFVPTAAVLAGNFQTFAGPGCNSGKQINLPASAGFVNNTIAPSLFSPAALKVEAILPTPADQACGRTTYGTLNNQDERMGVSKLDWQKSDKHTMNLRTFVTDLQIPSTYDGHNGLTHQNNAQADRVYSVAFSDTYLFSSSIVNSFHVGMNRAEIVKVLDNFVTWPQLGVNAPYQPAPDPHISISGGNGFAFGSGNSIINHDMGGPDPSLNNDVSWLKGNHQMGFGVSWTRTMLNYASGINSAGTMTFNGQALGLGMAEFMLGQADAWAQGNDQTYLFQRQQYLALYAQDSWKITSRLTVNYGVRWEPFMAFRNKDGYQDHFDPNQFAQNVHSTVYPQAPAGLFFPGDPQWYPGNSGQKSSSIAKNRYGEFAPRLGFVWDPEGKGRMTIRASDGIFFDRGALYSMSAMAQDTPYGTTITQTNVPMANPWASYPGGNPLPIPLSANFKFPQFASFVTDNPAWKPTTMNQWNVSIQRQFGNDWLVTANYIGNQASHLITAGEINPAQFLGLGPCTLPNGVSYPVCSTTANQNFRRVLYTQNPAQGQYYGVMAVTDDGGTQSYNAAYFTAAKRLSHGTTVLANYTWSHCIADLWNGNPGNTGTSSVTPFNRRNDRGNCNITDQRHVFNLSVVAQTPKFSNKALRWVLGDWQVSPIMKIKSSQFYTVDTGTDVALSGEGGANQRAEIVSGVNPYVSNHGSCNPAPCYAWANPAAYALPAPGTLGNLSNFSLKGPGIFQLDMALVRTFQIREKQTLQLRAEAFNLPNHLNPATPGSTSAAAAAGAATISSPASFNITTDISGSSGLINGDYRVVQFAMKYVF